MIWVAYAAVLFLTSYFLTGQLRAYAIKVNCIDIPNERSSHQIPTPRGAGVAFVVSFILGSAVLLYFADESYVRPIISFSLLGSAVAALGWVDDRYNLSSILRFFLQYCFVTCAVLQLNLFAYHPESWLFWIGGFFMLTYLVWYINMFNFMDGINGYAAMQAIFLSLSYLLFVPEYSMLMLLFASCVYGFMLWNFPVAKVFMGDVGSGFLGAILGLSPILMAFHNPEFIIVWFILSGLFMVDAGLTLLRRIMRRERFWLAHRQHAYQHLTQQCGSHVKITLAGLGLNLFYLLPIAYLVHINRIDAWLGLFIAYGGLGLLALACGAGRPEASK